MEKRKPVILNGFSYEKAALPINIGQVIKISAKRKISFLCEKNDYSSFYSCILPAKYKLISNAT